VAPAFELRVVRSLVAPLFEKPRKKQRKDGFVPLGTLVEVTSPDRNPSQFEGKPIETIAVLASGHLAGQLRIADLAPHEGPVPTAQALVALALPGVSELDRGYCTQALRRTAAELDGNPATRELIVTAPGDKDCGHAIFAVRYAPTLAMLAKLTTDRVTTVYARALAGAGGQVVVSEETYARSATLSGKSMRVYRLVGGRLERVLELEIDRYESSRDLIETIQTTVRPTTEQGVDWGLVRSGAARKTRRDGTSAGSRPIHELYRWIGGRFRRGSVGAAGTRDRTSGQ
jgi:hypothetical protein